MRKVSSQTRVKPLLQNQISEKFTLAWKALTDYHPQFITSVFQKVQVMQNEYRNQRLRITVPFLHMLECLTFSKAISGV